jgi:NIMA (never in mitosis gene a)-related kinase
MQFESPKIIKVTDYHVDEEEETLYLEMELALGGDFQQIIDNIKVNPLNEDQIYEFFVQIMLALMCVHDKNIVHGDVKPKNMLLFDENKKILKLSDFGSARDLKKSLLYTARGTWAYLAPEQRNGEGFTFLADVFASGLIVIELCGLSIPLNPNLDLSVELSRRGYTE